MMLFCIFKIVVREVRRIIRNRTLFVIMTISPFLLTAVFAGIYTGRIVTDIPIAAYDMDNTPLSRGIIRNMDAARSLSIESRVYSIDEIEREMRKGRIQGAVFIPGGIERDVKSGKQATVTVYKNTSNLIIGNLILKDAASVVSAVSGGVLAKKLVSQGKPEEAVRDAVQPIRVHFSPLYNPGYNYLNYLVPGLITAMLQIIIMLSAVFIINGEFEDNTIGELAVMGRRNVFIILTGKSIPYLAVFITTALLLQWIVFPVFSIPFSGSGMAASLLFILFICSSFFMGTLFSIIFRPLSFSIEAAIFFNTPVFIFSGYTFPVEAMPAVHQKVAQIFPYTYFIYGYFKTALMDAPFLHVLPEIRMLVFMILGFVSLSLLFLGIRIKRVNFH